MLYILTFVLTYDVPECTERDPQMVQVRHLIPTCVVHSAYQTSSLLGLPFDGGGRSGDSKQRYLREKRFFVSLGVTGAKRVGKADVEWEV